jgi:hypothetical protein
VLLACQAKAIELFERVPSRKVVRTASFVLLPSTNLGIWRLKQSLVFHLVQMELRYQFAMVISLQSECVGWLLIRCFEH